MLERLGQLFVVVVITLGLVVLVMWLVLFGQLVQLERLVEQLVVHLFVSELVGIPFEKQLAMLHHVGLMLCELVVVGVDLEWYS